MKLGVSFCNQKDNLSDKNFLLIDWVTGKKDWISFGKNNKGVTGLSQYKKWIFALYQGDSSGLLVIDKKSLQIVLDKELKEVIDPHSIFVDENKKVYIVSTGTDSVLIYLFDEKNKELIFVDKTLHPKNSLGDKDSHHVNSVFYYKKNLFISAFGLKKGETWSSTKKGYIYNMSKDKKEIENIYHPHSIFIHEDDIYYCESFSKSVKKNNHKIIKLKEGYTRGLAVKDDFLFLGVSRGRKVSKSTGLINKLNNPILEEKCELLIFEKQGVLDKYKMIKKINFLPEKNEIYDIIVIR